MLDEVHTYRGALGAHVTNILRRICNAMSNMNVSPNGIRYIMASATIGNPKDLASLLIRYFSFLTCLID